MFRKRWFTILLIIFIVLAIVYLLGPHPETPVYAKALPAVPSNPAALEHYIDSNEAQHTLKPNNEARIVWFDSAKTKTEYAIVYLHGFSASQEEGRPIHTNIAGEFGCNLYLSRLAEHGIDTIQPMINLTPEKLWESARQALAIGKQIGNKVILMSTSTGSTLALKLAADYPNDVDALVMMSPNIAIFDSRSFLLNNPWGLQIARTLTGSHYITAGDTSAVYKQYWYSQYPLEAATQLQELIETTMNKASFEKVKQPVLMLYYYKDNVHQDSVVSVPAMLKMFDELGAGKKTKIAMPNVGNHVMGSYIKSKDLLDVQQAIEKFMERTLGMKKAGQ
ncbi:alpha/beta hydrolase [Parafilimonas sp.]|uniref:alpha/beta hydrolase n=1 Tax=Parafilimonas sp. TaxID=1969739 RepID=UPI0039E688E4